MIKFLKFSMIMLFLLFCISLSLTEAQTHRALLIGINNYIQSENPNVSNEKSDISRYKDLEGAINDVEGIYSLLVSKFGFSKENIVVLKNSEATREKILEEINCQLIEKSKKGDYVLLYYSGHGSQVYNSKSDEDDKLDESIVPADAMLGAKDIRDKELAVLYNKILDKGAELNVIMDCCHSGSNARGLPRIELTRDLEPIKKDIADPTSIYPTPEAKGALIISAAQDYDSAVEFYEDSSYHGLLSYCLLKALRESPKSVSIDKLFFQLKGLIRSFGYFREPVLAGGIHRRDKSLFGNAADSRDNSIYVAVSDVDFLEGVEIQGGIALGLCENSELIKLADEVSSILKLRVKKNIGFTLSLCEVIEGNIKNVKEGDLFKISKLAPSYNSILRIWAASPLNEEEIFKVHKEIIMLSKNAKIELIADPTEISPEYTLYFENDNWNLVDINGKISVIDKKSLSTSLLGAIREKSSSPRVFICYPPTKKLLGELISNISENNLTIEFTDNKEQANYFLIGRIMNDSLEYCYAIPNIVKKDTADNPLPIRSDWFGISDKEIGNNLLESAIKINRVKGWMQLNNSSGNSKFCYKLGINKVNTNEIKTAGYLNEGDICRIILIADTSVEETEDRYYYVFAINVWGESKLLYPHPEQGNVENYLSCKSIDDVKKAELIEVCSFKVVSPFGLDNYYLLTTTEPLPDPTILEYSGIRTKGENESKNPLNVLISNIGYSTKGEYYNPENWSIERCGIISVKKNK